MTHSTSEPFGRSLGFTRDFDVLLHSRRIGGVYRRGSTIAFALDDDYREDPERKVLGLAFEEDIERVHYSDGQMGWWFQNLLPEGDMAGLRLIHRGNPDHYERERNFLLLAGGDLPGAVQLAQAEQDVVPRRVRSDFERDSDDLSVDASSALTRFSAAGVGNKLSMLLDQRRFTLPAVNARGEWLIKFPDSRFASLPLNEFSTMSLASEVGINVPPIRLVSRDEVDNPMDDWWAGELQAFAIQRFDRLPSGGMVHIEDLAQVRQKRPGSKYSGNIESVAAIFYRGHDDESLIEFTRRAAFNLFVGNSDAHLKNWSLIYPDGRRPKISPAYDLVSVVGYSHQRIELQPALRFANRHSYDVRPHQFTRLARKIGASQDLEDVAVDTVRAAMEAWDALSTPLSAEGEMLARVDQHAREFVRVFLGERW